jgi:hypothetical protein
MEFYHLINFSAVTSTTTIAIVGITKMDIIFVIALLSKKMERIFNCKLLKFAVHMSIFNFCLFASCDRFD